MNPCSARHYYNVVSSPVRRDPFDNDSIGRAPSYRKHISGGLTLIELVIAVALLSILASIAAPYFRELMLGNQITRHTNNLVLAANAARIEAIKRTQSVRISALDASSASNEWGPGLIVYVDNDPAGAYDAAIDEMIKTFPGLTGAKTVNGVVIQDDGTLVDQNLADFYFMSDGALSLDGTSLLANNVGFTLCDELGDDGGRFVRVRRRGTIAAHADPQYIKNLPGTYDCD